MVYEGLGWIGVSARRRWEVSIVAYGVWGVVGGHTVTVGDEFINGYTYM